MLQFLRVVWAFVTIDLNTINIDDDNFDEDHPETIVPVGLMAWCIKDKNVKQIKMIDENIMPIARLPT